MNTAAPLIPVPDGHSPTYVIITTRQGLLAQYGQAGVTAIENALLRLAHCDALLLIADDPHSTAALGLAAAAHRDAWGIKRLLADADAALRPRGRRIGALLIVGGPQVLPFHHLPNPVDDEDGDVPSDNPYACRDENYFAPEWPVGRLPGDASDDPGPLLQALKTIAARHIQPPAARGWGIWSRPLLINPPRQGIGYTAAVWRRASQAVYRAIAGDVVRPRPGQVEALRFSPPLDTGQIALNRPTSLAYFNLHGIADSPVWYGQRDPTEPGDHPHFPVALRPQDVRQQGHAPRIVFSEACYGAHILGKSVEQALALTFLAAGSQAVIGSTCASYGSPGMPLIAADLLGRAFWSALHQGLPAGEALRRAKISLAQQMLKRQGYLDSEDQKTLISFILLGDPLAHPEPRQAHQPDSICPALPAHIPILKDHPARQVNLTPAMLAQVKEAVAAYLPGQGSAQTILGRPRRTITGAKSVVDGVSVITLSQSLCEDNQQHRQSARLTFDEAGRLVKLAISH